MILKTPLADLPWKFRDTATRVWLPARVPGCVHTDLLAAGRIPDPFFADNESRLQWIGDRDWEYRATFSVSIAVFAAEVTELVADGLDTVAEVMLNGAVVGRSDNMFVAQRWSVRSQLKPGRNELRVIFHSATKYVRTRRRAFTPPREFCDPVGNAVRLRKQPSQFGWDWAPRLVTAGIWRDLRLESWSGNRLAHAHIIQNHRPDGTVGLLVTPEFARPADRLKVTAVCRYRGREVGRATGDGTVLRVEIDQPRLWWPAGQGAQPLYDLTLTATDVRGGEVGRLDRRLGLRTVALDRHPDRWGESFQFVINGRPIFAKGANWVPAHSFVATLTRDDYARDLVSAVEANMNCLRLWGGGVYESEDFYDLCDELGLLLWHDFMFSCALYPADRAFQESVRVEATQQVRRLQHRACVALWCGNNELAQLNLKSLRADSRLMTGYKTLFHSLLPAVVARHDATRSYWPSSEWRGKFGTGHALGEKSGDTHYWDVWHARRPVKDYEKWAFRFCSEFGMQSYSSTHTNATFCPPDDVNVFGTAMDSHQKNPIGNQIILDYVGRRYRFPKEQRHLPYLSQLNQAYCMQVGAEHFRRLMPRCMGALYWQLNDCWPATSWSSIEFNGRWKALHHAARRFYAPALATAQVAGDDVTGIANRLTTTVDEIQLFTVYDSPLAADGVLRWTVAGFDGCTVLAGSHRVRLRPGESVRHRTLRLRRLIERHGCERLYLRIALVVGNKTVSEQTVFLTAPRFISFPQAPIRAAVTIRSERCALLTFASSCFQHAVAFDLPGLSHRSEDNFFDLYPDEPRTVMVRLERPVTKRQIAALLCWHSLVDTYQ